VIAGYRIAAPEVEPALYTQGQIVAAFVVRNAGYEGARQW
jgi:hypothetical protein